MDSDLDLVDRYGLPLVILALIVSAVWRAWRFLRPFVQQALVEHVRLIKHLRVGMRVNTGSLKKQSAAMSAQADAMERGKRDSPA